MCVRFLFVAVVCGCSVSLSLSLRHSVVLSLSLSLSLACSRSVSISVAVSVMLSFRLALSVILSFRHSVSVVLYLSCCRSVSACLAGCHFYTCMKRFSTACCMLPLMQCQIIFPSLLICLPFHIFATCLSNSGCLCNALTVRARSSPYNSHSSGTNGRQPLWFGCSGPKASSLKYCDRTLSHEQRAEALAAMIPLNITGQQLTARQSPAVPSIELPAYYWVRLFPRCVCLSVSLSLCPSLSLSVSLSASLCLRT